MIKKLFITMLFFSQIHFSSFAQWQKDSTLLMQNFLMLANPDAALPDIFFISDSVGSAVGYDNCSAWNVILLFETIDGGISWNTIESHGSVCEMPNQFINDSVGYHIKLSGSSALSSFWKTNNRGLNWYQPDTTGNFYMGNYSSTLFFIFINETEGFITKDDSIYKTTNGGKSWALLSIISTGIVNVLLFKDAQNGYAISNNTIYKTTDGGNNWSIAAMDLFRSFSSLQFPSFNTGYAVGSDGLILKTADGGNVWNNKVSGTNANLNSIHCLNDSICYAVGDSGTILKTTDGGTSWVKQNSGVAFNLKSISCTSTHCYAVGNSGVILKTIDGEVGIKNISEKKIEVKISPNPFTNSFTITTQEPFNQSLTLELHNILGREVFSQQILNPESQIQNPNLPTGLYIYTINTNKEIIARGKIIKQ